MPDRSPRLTPYLYSHGQYLENRQQNSKTGVCNMDTHAALKGLNTIQEDFLHNSLFPSIERLFVQQQRECAHNLGGEMDAGPLNSSGSHY